MPGIKDAKTVLVIGATAGIGRALALAIHDLDSKPTVIVAGRRQERLDELVKQGERIKAVRFDVSVGQDELKKFAQDVTRDYPDLDAIVYSTGVQHIFDFTKPETVDLSLLDAETNTNYSALVKLIVFFLPHLLKLSEAGRPSFLVPITSGLAIVPLAGVPNYSASKAAVHALSLSLAAQLSHTKVQVMEILPPLVESELHDHQGTSSQLAKFWMPLKEFTAHAMEGLVRGDLAIPVGTAVDLSKRFEEGKFETAKAIHARIQAAAAAAA